MNAILSISSVLYPLITFPYVSRVLLPEGTGKVAFASSLIYYFTMVSQLGIPLYAVSACARVRDNRRELSKIAHELLMINLIMTAIAYLGFAGVMVCFPSLHDERVLYIIVSLGIIFDTIAMEWLYKALELYDYITVRSLVFKTIAVIATFCLIHTKEDYLIYGAITIFASSASGVVNFLNVGKYIDVRIVGGYDLKRHIKPVTVFFLILCASAVYTHMDTLMLGIIKSEVDVGYYNASLKVRNILVGVVAALGTVLLPRTSYYVEQGMMEEFRIICAKAIRFVCIVAMPLSVYFAVYAKESVYFLSGKEYTASIFPMQILMPTLLSIGIGNVFGVQMLVPLGKEKTILKSEITGAVVNVIANSILIPRFACVGAAIATLIAELTVTSIQGVALKTDAALMFRGVPYVNIIGGIAVGIVSSAWIKQVSLAPFVALVISAILFFGGYFGTLLITRESLTWSVFQQILTKAERILRKKTIGNHS